MTSANTIEIAGRVIGEGQSPYLVAEISANHNGDRGRALALIDAAHEAGADAVKLQTYTADTITLDHDGPGFIIEDGPWAGRKLHDLYAEASTPWDWHEALFARGAELGLTVFSSPFDPSSIDFLESLDCPAYKIASFELVDIQLIERAAATGKPLVMSTGMASPDEIGEAVAAAQRGGAGGVVLLHCVSAYPAAMSEMNLRAIRSLAERFKVPVGLSDHSLGSTAAIAATSLGAVLIEKHFTLRRSDGGPDAEFSAEPDELRALASDIRGTWQALGTGGFERPGGESAQAPLRRSLYAVADIAAGEMLTPANVRSIRPGGGIAPRHIGDVLGRVAAEPISRGTPLRWDLLS